MRTEGQAGAGVGDLTPDALPVVALTLAALFVLALWAARDVAIRILADRADARVKRTSEAERASAATTARVDELEKAVRVVEKRTLEIATRRIRA